MFTFRECAAVPAHPIWWRKKEEFYLALIFFHTTVYNPSLGLKRYSYKRINIYLNFFSEPPEETMKNII